MANALSVVIDVTEIESLKDRLLTVDTESIGKASLRAVNIVAERGFNESRKVMLRSVNLTDAYVKDRMEFVPANDARAPTASIIAFRPGGERKPSTRPVNLRQYAPIQMTTHNNWSNSGVATDSGRPIFAKGAGGAVHRKGGTGMGPNSQGTKFYKNPRKQGSYLPFIPRTGTTQKGAFNMPLGQKQAGLSVEVLKGMRKTISYAFVASARAGKTNGGQGLLVFKRDKNDHHGKGKLIPIYSLSVWQMFRSSTAQVIPLIADDLQKTATDEVASAIQDKLSTA